MAKNPKTPFRKGHKVCIFCGGGPMSHEHIWPQWAKSILPPSTRYRRHFASGRRSKGILRQNILERQGGVHSFRLKRVCIACNSGWMSQFEQDVRPFLERMIEGKRAFLSADQRDKLAQYLTYKMMILDWFGEEPIMPVAWAHDFYRDRSMPPSTYICAYNCFEGEWRIGFRSEAVSIAKAADWTPGMGLNTKSFAIGLGNLFVIGVTSTEVDLELEFRPSDSLRLWPAEPGALVWPPRYPINSRDAESLAQVLRNIGDDAVIADV